MTITHLFFDVGGVLGNNGWDREQRAAATRRFELEAGELEEMHSEAVAMMELGRTTLDEYLKTAVFYRPRSFTPEAFPAVVTPPSYSDFIFASASMLVSGRGCSSSATGGTGPLREAGISTGEISPAKNPSPFATE